MLTCQICNAPLQPGSLFCLGCGEKVTTKDLATQEVGRHTRYDGAGFRDEPKGTEADRRVVTILFADVSGYTSLSETLDPELVAGLLNDLFATLTEPVYRLGGVVDKYIGDAVMAVFGIPLAREDDAIRATMAALEMQERMARFAEARMRDLGVPLRIRIGVNTGLVLAGAVGGAEKKSLTVTGDTVNLAQRMESQANPGEILITDYTRRQLRGKFACEDCGVVQVKGRKALVETFRIVGLQSDIAAEERDFMVGRKAELALLGRLWSEVQAGKPKIVYLKGISGIGKTAIVTRAFGGEKRADPPPGGSSSSAGPVVAWVSCTEYQQSEPFALLGQLVRRLLDLPDQTPGLGDIDDALNRDGLLAQDDESGRAALRWLLSGNEDPAIRSLAPEQRKGLVLRATSDIILDRARISPLLLAIDDLQWVDDVSAEWLQQLFWAMEGRSARLLICATFRPGVRVIPKPDSGPTFTEIVVAPLPEDEARALFLHGIGRELVGIIPENRVSRWVAQGNGNPVVLRALADHVRDLGLEAESHDDLLPLSVMQLFMARIDAARISEGALKALNAAAVLGGQASTRRVAALTGDPDAEARIGELVDAGILRAGSGPGAVVFADGLFALATYERTLLSERRALHEKAATALGADGLPPAVIAEHIGRVGDPARAALALLAAAEHALRMCAPSTVLDLVEAARNWQHEAPPDALPADLELRLEIATAEAKAAAGNLMGALDSAVTAVKLSSKPDAPRALARQAEYLARLGRHLEALEVCSRAVAGLSSLDTADQGRIETLRIESLNQLGEHQKALAAANEALESAHPFAPESKGRLLSARGWALRVVGDLEGARASFAEALEVHQAARDDYYLAIQLGELGALNRQVGDHETARRMLVRGLRIVAAIGERRLACKLMLHLGEVHLDLGDVDKAHESFEMALRDYRKVGDRLGEGLALWRLSDADFRAGDRMAEANLLQGIMVLEDIGAKSHLDGAYQSLARMKIGQGNPKTALQWLKLSSEHAKDNGHVATYGINMWLLAQVCRDLGRPDAAAEWAGRSVEAFSELGPSTELLRSYSLWTDMLVQSGQFTQARDAFRAATAACEEACQSAGRSLVRSFSGVDGGTGLARKATQSPA